MSDERIEALQAEIAEIQMLSSAFLDLPTEEGLQGLLELDVSEPASSPADQELVDFVTANRDRDPSEVLTELGRDRVLLVRGMGADAIKPPYESLYRNCEPNVSIGALNRFYAESGFAPTGEYKDTSDQIGIELAFVCSLLQAEVDALGAEDADEANRLADVRERFMKQHLSRWGTSYADAMFEAAQTGYYRSMALLLKEAVA